MIKKTYNKAVRKIENKIIYLNNYKFHKIKLFKYRFNKNKYKETFLFNSKSDFQVNNENTPPESVFCFWTGTNDMPEIRKNNLYRMQEMLGVPVYLIDSGNLEAWVKEKFPLHPAYDYLSLTHKSDYLRAYFMHHYGGGYSDIKLPVISWKNAFREFNFNSEYWLAGYPEVSQHGVAQMSGRLGKDLRFYYSHLVGCGAMICKPYTPFTYEWLTEVDNILDHHMEDLRKNPGGIRDEVEGYPIRWTQILGEVYHPLQLKYMDHIYQNKDLLLNFKNYR